jgi:hypothetical protein
MGLAHTEEAKASQQKNVKIDRMNFSKKNKSSSGKTHHGRRSECITSVKELHYSRRQFDPTSAPAGVARII